MMRGRSKKCSSSRRQIHDRSISISKKHLKYCHYDKREHAKKDYWHRKIGGKNFEGSTSQDSVASTL